MFTTEQKMQALDRLRRQIENDGFKSFGALLGERTRLSTELTQLITSELQPVAMQKLQEGDRPRHNCYDAWVTLADNYREMLLLVSDKTPVHEPHDDHPEVLRFACAVPSPKAHYIRAIDWQSETNGGDEWALSVLDTVMNKLRRATPA